MPYGFEVDMWAIACIMGELVDAQPLFPGDDEIDQLYRIQQIVGVLTPEQQQAFETTERFEGLSFGKIGKPETVDYRYLGKIDKAALQFMKSLLRMNPKERLTAKQALRHQYFKGLNEEFLNDDSDDSLNEIKIEQKSLQQQKGNKVRILFCYIID